MMFQYKDDFYEVEIKRKDNKNTYVRVRNGKIFVTTHYFTSEKRIQKLLEENRKAIEKMIERSLNREKKRELFLLFGKYYDVIYGDFEQNIMVEDGKICVVNQEILVQWLEHYIHNIFYQHLMDWYHRFEEKIPIPDLKIKKMKTRWGVCNYQKGCITLNLELFRYEVECLDYVIIHELSHFLVPNHSKKFWCVVEKYCPNYKEIRKKLRDF